MAQLILKGFVTGMQKVEFTKLLRYEAGLALSEAKQTTDDIIDGKIVCVEKETLAEFKTSYRKSYELECNLSNLRRQLNKNVLDTFGNLKGNKYVTRICLVYVADRFVFIIPAGCRQRRQPQTLHDCALGNNCSRLLL